MKALKAFIKPFEVPQGSVKIKTYVNFLSSSRIGLARVNIMMAIVTIFSSLTFQVLIILHFASCRTFYKLNPLLLTNNIKYDTKNIEHENCDNIALKLHMFNILISKIKIFIL